MIGFVLATTLLAAIPPALPFAEWFVTHGVQVEIARVPGQPPWIRGTAELPAQAKRIAGVVTDFRGYERIFAPAIRKATVLETSGPSTRLQIVWPYPFPLRNRDAVIGYRLEPLRDGGFVLSWSSDPRPGDPHEGVRIARVEGETRISPIAPDSSRVTYTYLGDLGGKFPARAEEKAWRAEPVEYFRALRRQLGIPDTPK
jgi:hypothetical protein